MALSWFTAEQGWIRVHLASGLTLLALLIFRIAWGFIGSTTARFSNFLHSPPVVLDYFRSLMKEQKTFYAGHNPAGGLMVTALIVSLLAQAITGLFANDGIRFNAPLALWVGSAASDQLTAVHSQLFDFIVLLVWTHLVAVFFYLFVKGENLIKPMVTGYKPRHHLPRQLNLTFVHWAVALVVLGVAAAVVGLIAI